jgi:hypothetical protein
MFKQTEFILFLHGVHTLIGTRKLFELEEKKKTGHIETFTANEDKLEQQLLGNISKKSFK